MQEFLIQRPSKNFGNKSTHTRIADKGLNIYGGSYHIKEEELPEFWENYYENVFVKGYNEYLTEKQLGYAFAIDLDFRYEYAVTTRQHTKDDVEAIISLYLNILKEFYKFDSTPFNIFVMEKPNVNRLADGSLTKDGIHIIFGLQVDFATQIEIRKCVLNHIFDFIKLPLLNTWESVFDEGISKGSCNWQLYGSKKPANEAYQLTYHYIAQLDKTDNEFMTPEQNVKDFDFKNNFHQLSVQNNKNPKFNLLKPLKLEPPKSPTSVTQVHLTEEEENMTDIDYLLNVCIRDSMCKETQHLEWVKIAQALKNELGDDANEPFIKWTYNFGSENKKKECIQQITKYVKKTPMKDKDRLTIKSVHYYARINNEAKYKARFCKPVEFTIDEDIEAVLVDGTENSFANYFVKKWGTNFKCVDNVKKLIYQFTDRQIWDNNFNNGSKIREMISKEMASEFEKYIQSLTKYLSSLNKETDEYAFVSKKLKLTGELKIKLGKTNDKNNILKEIMDKIEDTKFENKLNKEKYILPIKNGKILDMKTLETRDRTIEHNFSYECDADYIKNMTAEQELEAKSYFMDLFCQNEGTMKCVLDILKSIMTGERLRYIYFLTGEGSNGKSLLFTLLGRIFKMAIDTIDTRVITVSKSASSLTTEFEKLDKTRFGFVTELDEKDVLNVKIIKKISGGDPVDYRGLYKGNATIHPTLNLGVVTNVLPDFTAQLAIINRIIVVPFNNTFETDKSFETKMLAKKDILFSFIMKYGTIRDNFELTEEMKVAKQEYIENNETIDYLKDFINKFYEVVPFVKTEKISRDTFRDGYNAYLKSKGHQ
jgi:phage/plasmid-associated DNA primase